VIGRSLLLRRRLLRLLLAFDAGGRCVWCMSYRVR
jgi:hypothetical protein